MNKQLTFSFTGDKVRITMVSGEPYFCAADVGKILGLTTVHRQVNEFKKGRHGVSTLTRGGNQTIIFVNEANLYRLIFRSKKENAIKFQDWVMEEVLPSIRKTGVYGEAALKIQRLAGILTRKTLTDRIDDSGENDRMHGYGYSNYTFLVYKLCNIEYTKQENFRDTLTPDQLESVENAESMIKSMLNMGKEYSDIKNMLSPIFSDKEKQLKE